ncbi:MAG: competence/damage-inducible protein A [Aureliella sp.]
MKAEIISVGDEMTSGQRLDTNSRWLSQQLADLGVATVRHTTVADDLELNKTVFAEAARRADIVVSTGGLGPTLDDLTRDALAAAFDAPLELHAESLQRVEEMFAKRERPMPERNRVQAMLPRGSRAILNPHGTAPGIEMSIPREATAPCRIFSLPGVPAEMVQMWHDSVRQRIVDLLGPDRTPWMFHTVKIFGIGESDVETRLPDLMRRDRDPRVGITVSRATISLRIAAQAHSQEEFSQKIAPTMAEIEAALGMLIFGSGEEELQHAVLRLLDAREATLAVLEIGAGALMSNWLLAASAAYRPGMVTCLACDSLAHAASMLSRVQPQGTGRADELTTLPALADCLRQTFKADIALVCGTYVGPDELASANPKAEVQVAIAAFNQQPEEKTRTIIGHPDILNDRVAKTALDTLRIMLVRMQ